MDHRNHREKHHQQRGKRQGFLEGLANLMLVGNAGKGGNQDDDQQANQADLGEMESEAHHQDRGGKGLYPESRLISLGPLGPLVLRKFFQHLTHRLGQTPAVAKPTQLLQGPAGK